MPGAQQLEEVEPAFRTGRAEPCETVIADLGAEAVHRLVARAGIVDRHPGRRFQARAKHRPRFLDEFKLLRRTGLIIRLFPHLCSEGRQERLQHRIDAGIPFRAVRVQPVIGITHVDHTVEFLKTAGGGELRYPADHFLACHSPLNKL